MAWREYEISAMKRALALAARARGSVEPNPMVGAVIVRNGRVVAEGYHRRFGAPHAEVNALREARSAARNAEMFVTLEPCSHYGKTPPCADAIIAAGVKRVVAAMRDPFAGVRGKGIARLRRAGIEVETGLCADEARALNAPFVKLRTKGLPWIIAKYAMTADGRIAAASGDSRWISCEESRRIVHKLRGRVDAILVGIGTALADDPLLTARPAGKRVATRVILDSVARLPLGSSLVKTVPDAPLLVVVGKSAPAKRVKELERAGVEVIAMPGKGGIDLAALARELGRREMTNVLVEGGSAVLGGLISARLVDEALVFMAPKIIGDGISPVSGWGAGSMKKAVVLDDVRVKRTGSDVLMQGKVRYPRK